MAACIVTLLDLLKVFKLKKENFHIASQNLGSVNGTLLELLQEVWKTFVLSCDILLEFCFHSYSCQA